MQAGRCSEIFSAPPEFCPSCGTILPVPTGSRLDYQCIACMQPVDVKDSAEVKYRLHFNDPDVYSRERGVTSGNPKSGSRKSKKKSQDIADGPVVRRECRKCGHNKMSYATLQLRSADEGQTVFYTCMNPTCKFKESENS